MCWEQLNFLFLNKEIPTQQILSNWQQLAIIGLKTMECCPVLEGLATVRRCRFLECNFQWSCINRWTSVETSCFDRQITWRHISDETKLQQIVLFVTSSVSYDYPVCVFCFDCRHEYLGFGWGKWDLLMCRNILLDPASVSSYIMKTIPERGLENPCWQASKGESENGPTCWRVQEYNNDDLVQCLLSMKQ